MFHRSKQLLLFLSPILLSLGTKPGWSIRSPAQTETRPFARSDSVSSAIIADATAVDAAFAALGAGDRVLALLDVGHDRDQPSHSLVEGNR